MKCPKCNGKLVRQSIAEVEIDQCRECAGIWFDFGELEDALAAAEIEAPRPVAPNPDDDALAAPRPRCGGTGNMVPVKNPTHGIHVDTCPVCYGKWLDGGELELLRERGVFASSKNLFRFLFHDNYE